MEEEGEKQRQDEDCLWAPRGRGVGLGPCEREAEKDILVGGDYWDDLEVWGQHTSPWRMQRGMLHKFKCVRRFWDHVQGQFQFCWLCDLGLDT